MLAELDYLDDDIHEAGFVELVDDTQAVLERDLLVAPIWRMKIVDANFLWTESFQGFLEHCFHIVRRVVSWRGWEDSATLVQQSLSYVR